MKEKQFYNNLKHELFKKLDQWKKFKPIWGENRRLFQITQTRTQHETNTQIYAKISQKNSIFKCIFMIINHITRIMLKNSHTTIIRKLKNSNP